MAAREIPLTGGRGAVTLRGGRQSAAAGSRTDGVKSLHGTGAFGRSTVL